MYTLIGCLHSHVVWQEWNIHVSESKCGPLCWIKIHHTCHQLSLHNCTCTPHQFELYTHLTSPTWTTHLSPTWTPLLHTTYNFNTAHFTNFDYTPHQHYTLLNTTHFTNFDYTPHPLQHYTITYTLITHLTNLNTTHYNTPHYTTHLTPHQYTTYYTTQLHISPTHQLEWLHPSPTATLHYTTTHFTLFDTQLTPHQLQHYTTQLHISPTLIHNSPLTNCSTTTHFTKFDTKLTNITHLTNYSTTLHNLNHQYTFHTLIHKYTFHTLIHSSPPTLIIQLHTPTWISRHIHHSIINTISILTHLTNCLQQHLQKNTSAGTRTRVLSISTVGSSDDNPYTTDVIKKKLSINKTWGTRVFARGPPPHYWLGPTVFDCADRTGCGKFTVVWPQMK